MSCVRNIHKRNWAAEYAAPRSSSDACSGTQKVGLAIAMSNALRWGCSCSGVAPAESAPRRVNQTARLPIVPASTSPPSTTVTSAATRRWWPPPRRKSAPPPGVLLGVSTSAVATSFRLSITKGMYTPRSQDRPTTHAHRRTCLATTSSESSMVLAKAASRACRCSVAAGPLYHRAPSSVSAARVRAFAVQSESSFIAGGRIRCSSRATSMAAPTGGTVANSVPRNSAGGGAQALLAAATAAPARAAASSPRDCLSSIGESSMEAAAAAAAKSGLTGMGVGSGAPALARSPSFVRETLASCRICSTSSESAQSRCGSSRAACALRCGMVASSRVMEWTACSLTVLARSVAMMASAFPISGSTEGSRRINETRASVAAERTRECWWLNAGTRAWTRLATCGSIRPASESHTSTQMAHANFFTSGNASAKPAARIETTSGRYAASGGPERRHRF
mmetsp:Transcript_18926/g.57175  ORF Transcript_18926/g.57175 Transcript_18926/m.57175 type:complete len:452 (-) Transcript_18926:333-1688(-)